MDTKLHDALRNITDEDYRVLRYGIQIANWCRTLMATFNIDNKTMAQRLKLTETELKWFRTAAWEYTIYHMAILEAIETEYRVAAAKRQAKEEASIKINTTLDEQGKTS